MKKSSIAPCGLICDLCYGYQREKNKCGGCNSDGNKNAYCQKCSVRQCPEKKKETDFCNKCFRYPCKRIKDLDKRYKTKYNESILENFQQINEVGIRMFLKSQNEKWKCTVCGKLLCVHKKTCDHCGSVNSMYPEQS